MRAVSNERRRVQRVRLVPPLRGQVGTQRIFVFDVSVTGIRIAHQEPIGTAGQHVHISFDWEGHHIALHCDLRWTAVERAPNSPGKKPLYHSGLSVRDVKTVAAGALRDLVHYYVSRALDEQKANARGIPAIAAQSLQTGNATTFVRHQLIGETWRETATTDPRQPITGFTISSAHPASEVQMLREAYAAGDASTREILRQMAALTISNREGVPARQYVP